MGSTFRLSKPDLYQNEAAAWKQTRDKGLQADTLLGCETLQG